MDARRRGDHEEVIKVIYGTEVKRIEICGEGSLKSAI